MNEVIKGLVDALDSEMNRFWTRFNIFAAVQIVVIAGLLANRDTLSANELITTMALILVLGWSIVGLIATCRGHDLQRSIVEAALEIEAKAEEESRIVTPILSKTRMPRYVNNAMCIAFAAACVAFWAVVTIDSL